MISLHGAPNPCGLGWAREQRARSLHVVAWAGQVEEVLQDVDTAAGRPQRGVRGLPVVLGADLNTGAHGLARLHPRFACDEMRWGRRAFGPHSLS